MLGKIFETLVTLFLDVLISRNASRDKIYLRNTDIYSMFVEIFSGNISVNPVFSRDKYLILR